jgi:hypothetical protein
MITPGMIIRPIVITPINWANGVLVRATVQARNVPRTKENSVETSAKESVLTLASQNSRIAKARM